MHSIVIRSEKEIRFNGFLCRRASVVVCTSFMFPRCPIRKSFPETSPSPSPRLRLYFFHAILITSPLSREGGTTTAVTTGLSHSGFFAHTFSPHALTAALQIKRSQIPQKIRDSFDNVRCKQSNHRHHHQAHQFILERDLHREKRADHHRQANWWFQRDTCIVL